MFVGRDRGLPGGRGDLRCEHLCGEYLSTRQCCGKETRSGGEVSARAERERGSSRSVPCPGTYRQEDEQ